MLTVEELVRLARKRKRHVARFLRWSSVREDTGDSLRWSTRLDISDADEAAHLFEEVWWGLVVFTSFGSVVGARIVANDFHRPRSPQQAQQLLDRIAFPHGSVGHHRTRPGVAGAKAALVSACEQAGEFREILHKGAGFRDRFEDLLDLPARQWGRTTCFDLVLRAGALGVGGSRFAPDRAYLEGSTGPSAGFERVWGIAVTKRNAEWCEALLVCWTENWQLVVEEVGVSWYGDPYTPGDFENALCIFQEEARKGRC